MALPHCSRAGGAMVWSAAMMDLETLVSPELRLKTPKAPTVHAGLAGRCFVQTESTDAAVTTSRTAVN